MTWFIGTKAMEGVDCRRSWVLGALSLICRSLVKSLELVFLNLLPPSQQPSCSGAPDGTCTSTFTARFAFFLSPFVFISFRSFLFLLFAFFVLSFPSFRLNSS